MKNSCQIARTRHVERCVLQVSFCSLCVSDKRREMKSLFIALQL